MNDITQDHEQVRDWDSPPFISLGACDLCGEVAMIEWRQPTLWERVMGEKEQREEREKK